MDEDDDSTRMVEHLNSCFQKNYHACPAIFSVTLEEALNEALQTTSIEDVRLTLYIQ
jgi:hypothetical protein